MDEREYVAFIDLSEAEIKLEVALGIHKLEVMLAEEMDEWWYGE